MELELDEGSLFEAAEGRWNGADASSDSDESSSPMATTVVGTPARRPSALGGLSAALSTKSAPGSASKLNLGFREDEPEACAPPPLAYKPAAAPWMASPGHSGKGERRSPRSLLAGPGASPACSSDSAAGPGRPPTPPTGIAVPSARVASSPIRMNGVSPHASLGAAGGAGPLGKPASPGDEHALLASSLSLRMQSNPIAIPGLLNMMPTMRKAAGAGEDESGEGFVAPHQLAARAYHQSIADDGGQNRKRAELRARTAILRMTGFVEPPSAGAGAAAPGEQLSRASDGTVIRRLAKGASLTAAVGQISQSVSRATSVWQ